MRRPLGNQENSLSKPSPLIACGHDRSAEQHTLDQVAGLTVTLTAGERAGAATAHPHAEGQCKGLRRGLRM